MIEVEVIYAQAQVQELRRVSLAEGATVAEALHASGLLLLWPELARYATGVFGRPVEAGHRLKGGDRVELYRPLIADPKDLRRARARKL